MGQAEGIIDDTCLVFYSFQESWQKLRHKFVYSSTLCLYLHYKNFTKDLTDFQIKA